MAEEKRQFLIEFLAETGDSVKEILALNLTLSALPGTAVWLGSSLETAMIKSETAIVHAGVAVEDLAASFHAAGVAAGPMLAAAEEAARAGLRGEDALTRFAWASRNLGIVTDTSTEQAAEGLARMTVAMGYSAGQVENLSSSMFALSQTTRASIPDLQNMLVRVGNTGREAGVTEPVIMALSAAMEQHGIKTRQAIQPMSRMLDLMTESKGGGKVLAGAIGLSGKALEEWNAAEPDQRIAMFMKELGKMDNLKAEAILKGVLHVGGPVAKQFLAMARDSGQFSEMLQTATGAMTDHSMINDELKQRNESFAGQMRLMAERAKALGAQVGLGLLPVLKGLAGIISGVVAVIEKIPKPILSALAGISLLTGGILTVRKVITSKALLGGLAQLAGAESWAALTSMGLTGALSALWAALWPIALAVAAAAAAFVFWNFVIQKAIVWWKEGGETVQFFKDVWAGLVADFNAAKEAIRPIIGSFLAMLEVLRPLKALLLVALLPVLGPLIPIVQALVTAFFFLKGLFKGLAAVVPVLAGPLNQLFSALKGAVAPLIELMVELKNQVVDALEQMGINSAFFMDILKSLGTVVKWVAIVAIAPLVIFLIAAIKVLTWVARAVTWVVVKLKDLGKTVGPLGALLLAPFVLLAAPIMWVIGKVKDLIGWFGGISKIVGAIKTVVVKSLEYMFAPIMLVVDAVKLLISKWEDVKRISAEAAKEPGKAAASTAKSVWSWTTPIGLAIKGFGVLKDKIIGAKEAGQGSSFLHISEGIHEVLPSVHQLQRAFMGVQSAVAGVDVERSLPRAATVAKTRATIAGGGAAAERAVAGVAESRRGPRDVSAKVTIPLTVTLDGMVVARAVSEHLIELGRERGFNEPVFPLRGVEPV